MKKIEMKVIEMFKNINEQMQHDFDNRFEAQIIEFKNTTPKRTLVAFELIDNLKKEKIVDCQCVYKIFNRYMLNNLWDSINNFIIKRR